MTIAMARVELSEPMLQCLLSEYLAELAKSSPENSAAFGERLESGGAVYNQAMHALKEAIVFSTLACAADSIDDFTREVVNVTPIVDEDVQRMRSSVFDLGMRTGVESIGMELARDLKLSDRVEVFHERAGRL